MNFGKIWRLALSAFDERFIPPDDRPPSLSSSTGPNTDRGIQRSTGADASRRGWVFVSVLIVITGLTLLSQSAGLLSLISYSSDRAGWDATRNQRNQVQSELAQLQQSRGTLDAEVKSKESDRDRIAGELNLDQLGAAGVDADGVGERLRRKGLRLEVLVENRERADAFHRERSRLGVFG